MKGLIFREFLDMVEARFGYEMVDEMLNETELESEGIYTSIGTYDYRELVKLLTLLSNKTKIKVTELLKQFGIHTFQVFTRKYPVFFENTNGAFSFLSNVDSTIHVEVRKLYPDAEHPTFIVKVFKGDKMIIEYSSERKLADFAEGLIIGCCNHFKEDITLSRINLADDGSRVEFTLTRNK